MALPAFTPAPTATATPLAIIPGVPVGIQIPAIALTATVEAVGLTADLAMAAPDGWDAIGWYQYGYWVGEAGNAVLTGHLDTNTGAPAIFWNLGDLEIGDPIWVDLGTRCEDLEGAARRSPRRRR